MSSQSRQLVSGKTLLISRPSEGDVQTRCLHFILYHLPSLQPDTVSVGNREKIDRADDAFRFSSSSVTRRCCCCYSRFQRQRNEFIFSKVGTLFLTLNLGSYRDRRIVITSYKFISLKSTSDTWWLNFSNSNKSDSPN